MALSILWTSFFSEGNNNHVFRIKSEFNQKIWIALGTFNYGVLEKAVNLAYGFHAGVRLKQKFHLFAGTDFHFGTNYFNIINAQLGFAFQL
jgi:hypothetical protein